MYLQWLNLFVSQLISTFHIYKGMIICCKTIKSTCLPLANTTIIICFVRTSVYAILFRNATVKIL